MRKGLITEKYKAIERRAMSKTMISRIIKNEKRYCYRVKLGL